ncbi:hypothetical protein ACFLU5_13630 [Bacteroidota bacterium]
MRFKEIELFIEILLNHQPKRVLEFGSGFSTLYYPDFLAEDAEWISVEHDRDWYENINDRVNSKEKVTIYQIDPEVNEWIYNGDYSDFRTYVDFPLDHGKFDLILVDGMARESCIDKSLKLLNPNGLLIVHDGNIKAYQPHIKNYPKWLIFEDYRKTVGGFGFGSIELDLKNVFDIQKHAKIWSIDSKIHNFFKFKFLLGKKAKSFGYFLSTD